MIVSAKPRERPILFRPEMVRAVLSGQKRQTRRPVYPQPVDPRFAEPGDATVIQGILVYVDLWRGADGEKSRVAVEFRCPYGETGDRLWVRETFGLIPESQQFVCDGRKYRYAADYGDFDYRRSKSAIKWKPSIHMPRSACRLELIVTETHAEPVQQFSFDDSEAEGVATDDFPGEWDRIYARQGLLWDSNPWVWVVSFERVNS